MALRAIQFQKGLSLSRADSKFSQELIWLPPRHRQQCLMSCITAWMPVRIERNPVRRSRFKAAVRSVAGAYQERSPHGALS
jgi:hypothetical protein